MTVAATLTNTDMFPESAGAHRFSGTRELKFLLDERQAAEIKSWARAHLAADPHSAPELGDGYYVNNLYLDTPAFDVYYRSGQPRRPKYRLRRYGAERIIWLEQKEKHRGRVAKRRVSIADAELSSRLLGPYDGHWQGEWFRVQVDDQPLTPVCHITYRRFARVGSFVGGLVRLTIDRDLGACEAAGWTVPSAPLRCQALFGPRSILELKFREVLPTQFRRLIQDHQLVRASFSKYRTCVKACLAPQRLADGAA